MSGPPSDPRLAEWARRIESLQWSAVVLDAEWTLRWVSPELREFIGTEDETELGYGMHIAESLMTDTWMRTAHPDSQAQIFLDVAPFAIADHKRRGRDPVDVI
jgi:hypothetical protein